MKSRPVLQLFSLLSIKPKILSSLVPIVSVAGGICEILLIKSIATLVSLAGSPHQSYVLSDETVQRSPLNVILTPDMFTEACLQFAALAILCAGLRMTVIYFNALASEEAGKQISTAVIRRALELPLDRTLALGKSAISSMAVATPSRLVTGIVSPVLQLASAAIYIPLIGYGTTQAAGEKVVIAGSIIFASYILIFASSKARLANINRAFKEGQTETILYANEILESLEEIKIGRRTNTALSAFQASDASLRKSETSLSVMASYPRLIVEAVALCSAAGLIYFTSSDKSIVPELAALIGGLIRINQQLGQGFACIAAIRATQMLLIELNEYLGSYNEELLFSESSNKLKSKNLLVYPTITEQLQSSKGSDSGVGIQIENLTYSHEPDSRKIVNNLSLEIPLRSHMVIKGPSGCGKSTILRLMMGLITPSSTKSRIYYPHGIDISCSNIDRALSLEELYKNLAYVPQRPEIIKGSVIDNIAFICDSETIIDVNKVVAAARLASLDSWINSLPGEYETELGEQGPALSGGQLQRMAIARAAYKNPSYLFLDEYTSSLDLRTQDRISSEIHSIFSNSIIIEVSHRKSEPSSATNQLIFNEPEGWVYC